MRSVKRKSYSRITLALDIIRKLDTEYHEVNIIKQQINLYDEMTIIESNETKLECNFDDVPTDKNNICLRALDSIREKFNIKKRSNTDRKENPCRCWTSWRFQQRSNNNNASQPALESWHAKGRDD